MAAKILKLEEVVQWGRGPIWLQERNLNFCTPVIYDLEHSPYLRFKICTAIKSDRHLKYEGRKYSSGWRCFETKPTAWDLKEPFVAEQKGV